MAQRAQPTAGTPEHAQWQALIQCMGEQLRMAVACAIGIERSRPHGRHPVYLVGLSPDGHLVGLHTRVIWT